MDTINFKGFKKLNVETDFYNVGTDKEYFYVHFNYKTNDKTLVNSFSKSLQESCDKQGYPVYVDDETMEEIQTIQIEIHNTEFKDEKHIDEALHFIDAFIQKLD